jgi:hypothetical protein
MRHERSHRRDFDVTTQQRETLMKQITLHTLCIAAAFAAPGAFAQTAAPKVETDAAAATATTVETPQAKAAAKADLKADAKHKGAKAAAKADAKEELKAGEAAKVDAEAKTKP